MAPGLLVWRPQRTQLAFKAIRKSFLARICSTSWLRTSSLSAGQVYGTWSPTGLEGLNDLQLPDSI